VVTLCRNTGTLGGDIKHTMVGDVLKLVEILLENFEFIHVIHSHLF